jgi:hypothetical protein
VHVTQIQLELRLNICISSYKKEEKSIFTQEVLSVEISSKVAPIRTAQIKSMKVSDARLIEAQLTLNKRVEMRRKWIEERAVPLL